MVDESERAAVGAEPLVEHALYRLDLAPEHVLFPVARDDERVEIDDSGPLRRELRERALHRGRQRFVAERRRAAGGRREQREQQRDASH